MKCDCESQSELWLPFESQFQFQFQLLLLLLAFPLLIQFQSQLQRKQHLPSLQCGATRLANKIKQIARGGSSGYLDTLEGSRI